MQRKNFVISEKRTNATSSAYGESPMSKFYKSRETISRPPTAYGRTTVYDFDEWARSHYGATFQRDMRYRERQKFKQQRKAQTVEDVKSEKVILLIGVLILLAAFLSVDSDYDAPDSFTTFGATNNYVNE
ncbi:dnaJ -like subfamily C member 30 [Asbolus verrucosus]|uniref:DnaJ-like subfamily C member 30 n=1 Tax=Asbolus verrucosus TaxID=1661398 RepID=A0A482V9S7_ASBVE|nr:dnaJ -like subfamily C member 30 [Asbolus verrucosus]